jgi:cytohesin
MSYQNPQASWFKKCFFALSFGIATVAGAHETDQHTLPEGRQFADIGPLLSRWHYRAVKGGVDKVNAEIKLAIARHASEGELRRLQDPDRLVRAVNKQFPWAMDVIEGWDTKVRSEALADQFPGYVVGYKQPFANIYQHTQQLFDPRVFFRLWLGANLKAYGHYIGTDKIGHFTDEGMNYYNVYHKARRAGDSEEVAVKRAIFLGTDDFLLGEKGMLGLLSAGDYSNGDLTSNWLGFSFYRNLTQPWPLQGKMQPAMCDRDGPYWKLAPHVRIDSNFFQVFVCDAEDEALNPGLFETGMRKPLRKAIQDRREAVLEHYVDEHGCRRNKEWFDAKLETFHTYYGQYYGHAGKYDELVAIGNTLFRPVKADAKVDARDEGGMTPLHTAAWSGNAQLVREFLRRGADPNAVVRSNEKENVDWGNTPLHYAAASGNVQTVQLLLNAGANVNARNTLGVTPLHRAVRSPEITRMLIEHGAKVEAADARGRTPLHWAACDSLDCHETAVAMIARGASPDARDHQRRTPLHLAADAGCDAVARELLRAGADMNAADDFRETPLHLASSHEASPMAKLLVRAGAKVNATDSFGCTALHDAARVGAAENLALLLNAGASPSVADAFGATPAKLAAENGCDTPVAMLTPTEANIQTASHRTPAGR